MYRSAVLRFSSLAVCLLLLAATAAAQDDFTLVVLPDTQFYSQDHPEIFAAETRWIADNASRLNIRFVVGVGDIVNQGSQDSQWRNADAAISTLDSAGIPYALAIGNHDYRYSKPSLRTAPLFNQYLGPQRYAAKSYYGSQFPAGSNENFYVTFDAGGRKYLVLLLEFYPRRAALDWADSIIAQHPDREVVVTTHGYLFTDTSRVNRCDYNNAEAFGVGADHDGEELWREFLEKQDRVFLVLSGHIHGVSRRTDLASGGRLVNQILSNFQHETNGGNGYIRILKFRPALNRIEVTTYSPYLNQYRTDSANQFTITYDRSGAESAGTGEIRGKVRNEKCEVISGANVAISSMSTDTTSSGNYALSAASPQQHSVTVNKAGYVSAGDSVNVHTGYSSMLEFFLIPGTAEVCPVSPASTPTVRICTPANESTVTSSFSVQAGAYSPAGVRHMQIWLDGARVYHVDGSQLDTSVTASEGRHRLVVVAEDNSGTVAKSAVYVTVGSSTGACLPQVSSTANVNLCEPTDGATVGPSSVRVRAAAYSPAGVSFVQIYLDGVKVHHVDSDRLDTTVPATAGTRRLTVQARDQAGVIFKKTVYVNVQ
jgi:predicted MPP superfamily phosphohydrolase